MQSLFDSYLSWRRLRWPGGMARSGGHAVSGTVMILRPSRGHCRITVVDASNATPVIRHDETLLVSDVSPDVHLPLREHLARIGAQYKSRRLKTVVLLGRNDCYFSRSLIHAVPSGDLHETVMLQAESSFPDAIQDLAIDYVALPGPQGDQSLLLMAGKHQSGINAIRSQLSDAGFSSVQILPEPAVACLPLNQFSDSNQLTLSVLLRTDGRLEVFAHQSGILISHQGRLLSEPDNRQLSARQICGEILRTVGALDAVAEVFSVPAVQLLPGDYDHDSVQASLNEGHPQLIVRVLPLPTTELPGLAADECYERLLYSGAVALLQSEKLPCHNLAKPRHSLTSAERRKQLITRCGLICVLAVIMMLWRGKLERHTLQEQLDVLQQQINELDACLVSQESRVQLEQTLTTWSDHYALPKDLLSLIQACLPDSSACRICRIRINRTNLAETQADIELEGFADHIDTVVIISESLLRIGGFRLYPYQVEKVESAEGFPVRFTFNLRAVPQMADDSTDDLANDDTGSAALGYAYNTKERAE